MINEIKEHRSIRNFSNKPLSNNVLQEILLAATRASTIGTMQLYSIIVTQDEEIKNQLSQCHFNQPASKAPVIITFCADVNRFEKWCTINNAKPDYQNFVWFVNAAIDTLLASQNLCLQAQANGLGICYLGTTLYTADKIIEILNLPKGVIPITSVAVGYSQGESNLTHRLPLDAVVHYETYKEYTENDIKNYWSEIENSEQTKKLLVENDLPNLAQIFTERRYKSEDNQLFSHTYLETLKKQGFIK